MAIKFNETYVDSIARGHLEPGEQVVARAAGVHKPLWALGIPFFFKTFLILATDRRLLLMEHRRGLIYDRLERVESVPFGEVQTAKVAGLLLKKKLKLAFASGRAKLALALPGFFGPLPRNTQGAKDLVSAWERGKSLPAPAAQPALGAGAPMAQHPFPS